MEFRGKDLDSVSEHGYILNNYKTHKFDDQHILVTTDHSDWEVLDEQEYKLLRLRKVHRDKKLFERLEKKGVILTEENVNDVVRKYRRSKEFLFRGPTLHIITPTMRCNARCVYCHSRAKHVSEENVDMDRETAKKIVNFILKAPSDSHIIEFQGGDCLLNFDITEFLIDYARERANEAGKEIQFSIVTNLTMMNEDIIRSLKRRNIRGIATSLDGPKEIHDKNRFYVGGGGTYDETVHWIKRMNNELEDHFNLNALSTITKHSLGKGREIVDEYRKLGFNSVWLRPLNNLGFANDVWDEIGYSNERFFEFWKTTLDYIIELNRKGEEFTELMSVIFAKKVFNVGDPNMVDIMAPCGAGIGQLLYKYNGDIHTCDEGKIDEEFKLGNVFESEYEDLFDNETLVSMVDISSRESYVCNNCAWKSFCGVCPVTTYKQQGSIVSKLSMDVKTQIYRRIIEDIFRRIIFEEDEKKVLKGWTQDDKVFG